MFDASTSTTPSHEPHTTSHRLTDQAHSHNGLFIRDQHNLQSSQEGAVPFASKELAKRLHSQDQLHIQLTLLIS